MCGGRIQRQGTLKDKQKLSRLFFPPLSLHHRVALKVLSMIKVTGKARASRRTNPKGFSDRNIALAIVLTKRHCSGLLFPSCTIQSSVQNTTSAFIN